MIDCDDVSERVECDTLPKPTGFLVSTRFSSTKQNGYHGQCKSIYGNCLGTDVVPLNTQGILDWRAQFKKDLVNSTPSRRLLVYMLNKLVNGFVSNHSPGSGTVDHTLNRAFPELAGDEMRIFGYRHNGVRMWDQELIVACSRA